MTTPNAPDGGTAPGSDEQRIPLSVTDLPSHALFTQEPPRELFHYTSLQGAYGIITSKTLWLTKIQYLNDLTELRYAIDLFRAAVRAWPEPLDSEERAFIDNVAHQLGSFTGTNVCVASFCANGDLLSQWRAYGAEARGVALGFSGLFLKGLTKHGLVRTWKCIYERSQHETIIRELVRMSLICFNIGRVNANDAAKEKISRDITGYFNTTFLRVAPILKDHGFHEENEWRIVTASVKSTHANYDVVFQGLRLLPVYKLEFPAMQEGNRPVLTSVHLGPMGDAELTSGALSSLLWKHGHVRTNIGRSQIPYRAPR